jgi:hypothetical protein
MPLHLVTPIDRAQDARAECESLDLPAKGWRSHAADLCYIVLRGSTFLASSYLMALGLPLLFFLLICGRRCRGLLRASRQSFADRFLGAEQGRQIGFLDEFKFVLIGVATLVVVWRLPRFINDLERELSGRKAVKNILATHSLRGRMGAVNWTAVALGLSMVGSALWGVWATDKLLALDKREVVTVQLSRIMGDFIEAEARAGRPPEETKMRVQAYLQGGRSLGRNIWAAKAARFLSLKRWWPAARRISPKPCARMSRAAWEPFPMRAADLVLHSPTGRRLALWAGLGAAALALTSLAAFAKDHALMINASPSLPYWAIWLDRGALPHAATSSCSIRPPRRWSKHFGAEPNPFGKRVSGMPGDIVTEQGPHLLRQWPQAVAVAKLTSRLGEPLALGPTGAFLKAATSSPPNTRTVSTAAMPRSGGSAPRILGVGRPIL